MSIFSVNTVFFTILGYSMSYIEFVGTILYLWSVWLIAKRRMLTWPVGIASSLLYMVLFYQIRLYADAIEQVYYLGASAYGWWYWHLSQSQQEAKAVEVKFSSPGTIGITLVATALLSMFVGAIIGRIHLLLPGLFPQAASYPFVDAATTVMSFTAMIFMARKRIESWLYWIMVDVVGVRLYYIKDVKFISLLYVVLLAMAIKGLVSWFSGSRRETVDVM